MTKNLLSIINNNRLLKKTSMKYIISRTPATQFWNFNTWSAINERFAFMRVLKRAINIAVSQDENASDYYELFNITVHGNGIVTTVELPEGTEDLYNSLFTKGYMLKAFTEELKAFFNRYAEGEDGREFVELLEFFKSNGTARGKERIEMKKRMNSKNISPEEKKKIREELQKRKDRLKELQGKVIKDRTLSALDRIFNSDTRRYTIIVSGILNRNNFTPNWILSHTDVKQNGNLTGILKRFKDVYNPEYINGYFEDMDRHTVGIPNDEKVPEIYLWHLLLGAEYTLFRAVKPGNNGSEFVNALITTNYLTLEEFDNYVEAISGISSDRFRMSDRASPMILLAYQILRTHSALKTYLGRSLPIVVEYYGGITGSSENLMIYSYKLIPEQRLNMFERETEEGFYPAIHIPRNWGVFDDNNIPVVDYLQKLSSIILGGEEIYKFTRLAFLCMDKINNSSVNTVDDAKYFVFSVRSIFHKLAKKVGGVVVEVNEEKKIDPEKEAELFGKYYLRFIVEVKKYNLIDAITYARSIDRFIEAISNTLRYFSAIEGYLRSKSTAELKEYFTDNALREIVDKCREKYGNIDDSTLHECLVQALLNKMYIGKASAGKLAESRAVLEKDSRLFRKVRHLAGTFAFVGASKRFGAKNGNGKGGVKE